MLLSSCESRDFFNDAEHSLQPRLRSSEVRRELPLRGTFTANSNRKACEETVQAEDTRPSFRPSGMTRRRHLRPRYEHTRAITEPSSNSTLHSWDMGGVPGRGPTAKYWHVSGALYSIVISSDTTATVSSIL